jgi:hypothetical protein
MIHCRYHHIFNLYLCIYLSIHPFIHHTYKLFWRCVLSTCTVTSCISYTNLCEMTCMHSIATTEFNHSTTQTSIPASPSKGMKTKCQTNKQIYKSPCIWITLHFSNRTQHFSCTQIHIHEKQFPEKLRNLNAGCTNFPNTYGPPQNSRCYHTNLIPMVTLYLWFVHNCLHDSKMHHITLSLELEISLLIMPQSIALLHELTGGQPNNSLYFMESKESLPCAQEPCTCFWSDPDYSSPQHPTLCLSRSTLMLSS